MTGIVERLRDLPRLMPSPMQVVRLGEEAADEIERLQSELTEALEMLEASEEAQTGMQNELERLTNALLKADRDALRETERLEAEVNWLRTDKEAISQTASDYLHEIERLQGIFAFAEAAGKAERDGLVAEIMRLRADNAAISQTASDYLHKIGRLLAALEPFARNADAASLSKTLGHISREDLWRARDTMREDLHELEKQIALDSIGWDG